MEDDGPEKRRVHLLRRIFLPTKQAGDDVHRESPPLQEAAALGALFGCVGRLPVFSSQHRTRPLDFVLAGQALDDVVGNALRFQIVADPCRTVFACERMRAGFSVALVGKLPARGQLVEQCFERLRLFGARRELARKLGSGMLAPREIPERPGLQFPGRVRRLHVYFSARLRVGRCSTFLSSSGSAAMGSGATTPAFSRILASISRAMAGFSLR